MKRFLIVHYGEIGLKGANAQYFIDKLKKRLKYVLEKRFRIVFDVVHVLRRFIIELPSDFVEEDYVCVIAKVFGVKNFKFCYAGPLEIEKLGKQIIENFPNFNAPPLNFRVSVKRSMVLDFNSTDAERRIGELVLESGHNIPVKLKNPEFVIDIEFFNDFGFFSFMKYFGPGGLSGNSQGKLVSLISAGIDSPVASYKMMRRGARVIFVHFHAYPFTDKSEMEQVSEIVKILSLYQFDTKLYLVPFGQVQKIISTTLSIPSKVRTVLYRRFMLRIAEKIAKKEGANGLITGDSFGQVASQTPENLFAVHAASTIPLYQPLISVDKEEIIQVSEAIGTFDISKLPCKDSCTLFAPEHPELKANLYDLLEYENDLDVDLLVNEAVESAEVSMLHDE